MKRLHKHMRKRSPNGGLILHSDQGNQYRSNSFRKLIRKKGFESSFSRAGCPYDNAVAESFFRMFKQEEANHIYYRTAEELEASVDEYIHFFNDERPHDRLGNLTPNEKEEEYYKSLTQGVMRFEPPKAIFFFWYNRIRENAKKVVLADKIAVF